MYIHSDVFCFQTPKKKGHPCGDAYEVYRDSKATIVVLADGLGSGIKAHIAAKMYVSRLLGLIKGGVSVREAFRALTDTMDKVWGTGDPFAVFTLLKIMNNGNAVVLSYEMPPPILVNPVYAHVLKDRVYTKNKAIIHESTCKLSKDEGILLVSDGITQAGIGKRFRDGWGTDGIIRYIQSGLTGERLNGEKIVVDVHAQALSYWPKDKGDDCSALFALNRNGIVVNLMCGPPLNKEHDSEFVNSFMRSGGIKIICGGSTSKVAASVTGREINISQSGNKITPPSYEIKGIDMVCEGMVTLNQAYHLLEEDINSIGKQNPATELANYLKMADRINIWEGLAQNVGEGQIEFKQQGLLNRSKILKALTQRLELQGKLIDIKRCV